MKQITLLFYFLVSSILPVFSQGTRLLRQPTISQQFIAFVYADDLWLVNREGGDAKRLTTFEGIETNPHFSPDGKMIAFTGQYDGNLDVYVIPAEGGEPKRLTWHPGADIVQGWTPDGKEILFRSDAEAVPTKIVKFYTIGLEGGLPKALATPQAAYGELSPDGKSVAYTPITYWDIEWRNYRGGQAQPIWIEDLQTHTVKKTPQPDRERHMDPIWYNNVVYFMSELDFASNIWSFDPVTNEIKQITFHKDFDVKSLDACEDRIVYEQGGYLHLLIPESGATTQLIINVQGDFNWARPRWEDVVGSRLINASLSSTGKRALFEYRGDIFTVPKENGEWRNITQSSGVADRYPIWSPDGQQIAWFSDETGEYQLVIADQYGLNKKTIPLNEPTFFFNPAWSPDGKYIAFTDTDYNLWNVNVNTGNAQKADTERYAHPNRSMNPVWSPDSKWIAYVRLLDNQFKAVKIFEVATGESHQVTDGLADAITPVWDEGGKYLYFLASTDFALNTGWLDMSSYNMPPNRGLYMVVLGKNTTSPLFPKSDEEELKKEPAKDEKKEDKKEGKKETKDSSKVVIDLEGIQERILAVDVPLRSYAGLREAPKDYIFYMETVPNQTSMTLHRYSFKDRKATEFMTGISQISVSKDRKNLLYQNENTWGIVKTDGPPVKVGDGKLTLSIRMKIVPQEEWKQIFREGWRYQRDFLYVNNTHGAPWNDIYTWYSPWIEHVRHRTDLNYVVDILGGEISVGHSYTSGGNFPKLDEVQIGLLGCDFEEVNGYYQIKKIYTGENWNPGLQAPLALPGSNVKEGDYLLEVNGKALKAPMNPYSLFEATVGKQTKIKISSKTNIEDAKTAIVIPIASETQLRLRDWVEGNRRKVDALSNGQLGYVYIPNTGQPGYTYFNRYYFSQQDKKGMVIDERNNGGGSAADYMVDIMNRNLMGYFNSNASDHKPFTTPMAGVWGPKVMIMNERSGSGGDLLPYLFRKMNIGPLVGTRTWGGLVGTWDTPLFIDGGRMVAPRGGFFDTDGNWAIEGVGIAPDIEVFQDAEQVIQGKDPQLERAIQEALELIPSKTLQLKPEPTPPNLWKRPSK